MRKGLDDAAAFHLKRCAYPHKFHKSKNQKLNNKQYMKKKNESDKA
jgi:hypothetical protein